VLFPKTLVFHWSALCLGIAALLAFFERDPSLRSDEIEVDCFLCQPLSQRTDQLYSQSAEQLYSHRQAARLWRDRCARHAPIPLRKPASAFGKCEKSARLVGWSSLRELGSLTFAFSSI
jgi:hypothetical protein